MEDSIKNITEAEIKSASDEVDKIVNIIANSIVERNKNDDYIPYNDCIVADVITSLNENIGNGYYRYLQNAKSNRSLYQISDSFNVEDEYLESFLSVDIPEMANCLPYLMCAYLINRKRNNNYQSAALGKSEDGIKILAEGKNAAIKIADKKREGWEIPYNINRDAHSFASCFSLYDWNTNFVKASTSKKCVLMLQAVLLFSQCIVACSNVSESDLVHAFNLFECHVLANIYPVYTEMPEYYSDAIFSLSAVESVDDLVKVCREIRGHYPPAAFEPLESQKTFNEYKKDAKENAKDVELTEYYNTHEIFTSYNEDVENLHDVFSIEELDIITEIQIQILVSQKKQLAEIHKDKMLTPRDKQTLRTFYDEFVQG
jgi:hypothetical protein